MRKRDRLLLAAAGIYLVLLVITYSNRLFIPWIHLLNQILWGMFCSACVVIWVLGVVGYWRKRQTR